MIFIRCICMQKLRVFCRLLFGLLFFCKKQFIWYDVKNLKPQTHYKDLCCLCHWNLKAINAKWAIFDMKDYNYSLFLQINVTLRYLWSSVLLFSVERRRGENSCSVTRGTTQRSWSQTLWGKKKKVFSSRNHLQNTCIAFKKKSLVLIFTLF